jgi:hypothetical protein
MMDNGIVRQAAQAEAERYLEEHYPPHLSMAVLDIQPLAGDIGWVVWPQTADYIRSNDPMDFVVAPPLLITAGPTTTPLPTHTPVSAWLDQAHLALAGRDGSAKR